MPTYLSPGVYVEEAEAGSRPIEGVGTAVAAFLGLANRGPANTPTFVTNWSQFTSTFGEAVEGSYLAHAVYGYLLNGGGACYVVRVGGNGGGPAAKAELTAGGDTSVGAFQIVSLEGGAAGNDITVEVTDPGEGAPEDSFKLVVKKAGTVVEEHDKVTVKAGKANVLNVVTATSKLIRLEKAASGGAVVAPAKGSVQLAGGGGPSALAPEDYVGDASQRTGLGALEAVDAVTMVCAPDLMAAYQMGMIDLDGVQAVQGAIIAHCEQMGDRVAVLDPPPGLNAAQLLEWRMYKAAYDSRYAALYWPWVSVFDPPSGQEMLVPPSGHIAGIWGRNDDTRGVHKAPANEVIRGAVSLELQITKAEQDLLNPHGVNCLRAFPGRGIRVWGARTLSSDAAWRYLNVRRLFNYLEESILDGTQWAVFEPNDDALWAKLRRTISAFLTNEWRKGSLFGLTPDQAFYVKCDEETNPAEAIDSGIVTCEIGVAPVKPAEFVVFKLSQYSGGSTLNE